MKSMSGAGVLVAHGREINVLYDLVQSDAAPDAAPDGPCFSAHGPAMVQVPTGFCIDGTEVTNAQ